MCHLSRVALLAVLMSLATAACDGETSVSPPGELTVTRYPSFAIRSLTWSGANDAPQEQKFELQWRFGDVPVWVPLAVVDGISEETEYGTASGQQLVVGTNAEYCYRIRRIEGEVSSAWSDEVCADMRAGEPGPANPWPAPPRNVTTERVDGGGVKLTWDPVEPTQIGNPEILVWRRARSEGAYQTIATLEGGSKGYTDPAGDTNACYRVASRTQGTSVSPDMCATR